MGIFSSIKKAIGFGSFKGENVDNSYLDKIVEAIDPISDDGCACGGNCTCGQAEAEEAPKATTAKTVLPNGTLKEEKVEEFEAVKDFTQPGRTDTKPAAKKPAAKKTTAATSSKIAAKPKAKKASNKVKSAKKK